MLVTMLQNMTGLLLAGALVYAILAIEALQHRRTLQQALIGAVLGLLVIALGLDPYLIPPRNVPMDASAGPLIFAGYLGGPLGASIAAVFSVLFVAQNAGPIPLLGVFYVLASISIGMVASALRPTAKWPEIPGAAVRLILLLFPLPFVVPILVIGLTIPIESPFLIASITAGELIVIGYVSILLSWVVLNYAYFFTFQSGQSIELAKRLDLTLHHSGTGLFEHVIGEPTSHYDAASIKMFGLDLPPGDIPTEAWQAQIHPEDRPDVLANIERALGGKVSFDQADFRVIRKDGTIGYIRSYWTIERDGTGTATRVIGLNTDTTDIHLAEQAHLATSRRMALIIQNLPGVVFQVDISVPGAPQLSYISPTCLTLWGYCDQEFYDDPGLLRKLHDPDDLSRFLDVVRRGVETGAPITHRHRSRTRDGTFKWLDFHGSASRSGAQVNVEAIVLDVSTEVAMQEQVEQEREIAFRAQKSESIGQLTGGVAHDFNNLLAVIVGNLELLGDENEPAMQKELVDVALKAALRGAGLTQSLLAFARKARLTPEVLDLNHVMREAQSWMNRTVPESVSVGTVLADGLWPISADRNSLESALLNLILNARDAMANHGHLTIETQNIRIDDGFVDARQEEVPPGRYVMLAVSDTGSGVSPEFLASIFEPFFTTKPPGSGSGLGLSMVLGFVRQSGGTVQVYSEPDQGTTFKLYFPAVNPPGDPVSDPAGHIADLRGHGQRVLLAEDEDAVRDTLVTILTRAGYDVIAAPSGDAALALYDADPHVDVLLTDIVMPGTLQGTHLARSLRERRADLPVIFMSGYASEATVHGNGLHPADIRLMKPVQRTDLLAALSKSLRSRRPE